MSETEVDKALEEAKRVMARLVRMPPKPHKAESAKREKARPKNTDRDKRS